SSIEWTEGYQILLDAGFLAFVLKPVRPSALLDAMATAWAGRNLPRFTTPDTLAKRRRRTTRDTGTLPGVGGTRVLLAEDNRTNQIVATDMLKLLGCTVDVACN